MFQHGRRRSRDSSGGRQTQLRSPMVQRPSASKVTLQGWLFKQGSEGLMLWKRRWFVLSEYCLFYYKGEFDSCECVCDERVRFLIKSARCLLTLDARVCVFVECFFSFNYISVCCCNVCFREAGFDLRFLTLMSQDPRRRSCWAQFCYPRTKSVPARRTTESFASSPSKPSTTTCARTFSPPTPARRWSGG